MDAELKRKWVEALRSGAFKQLQKAGPNWIMDGRHCCLGVLGELMGERKAMQEYNFTATVVDVACIPHRQIDVLIEMNDGAYGYRACTFPEIADYIEANL